MALAAIVAHANALGAGFVWDDDDYVTRNVTLRSLAGLGRIWFEPGAVAQYYPLTFTTLWLEYQIAGVAPLVYHATNVALHAAAAALCYQALALLQVPGALIGALLFAVHPVHVESVAWIAERKNVLSTTLYLGATVVYLRGLERDPERARPPAAMFAGALALYAGALLSKTVTCSLPVALAIADWWRHGRVRPRAVVPLVPFVVLGVVAGLGTVWLEKHHVGAQGAAWDLSLVERGLVAGRVVCFYAGKLLWPAPLIFNYPRWQIDTGVWWQWLFPSAVAGAALAGWTYRSRVGRGPLACLAFFVVTLAPALGFIDVYPMRYSFVADHFQYLASIGPLALAGSTLVWLCGDRSRAVVAAVAVVLSVLSWRQAAAYVSLEALWRDTLRKHPASTLALVNLGHLEHERGRDAEALVFFEQARMLEPAEADVRNDIGLALLGLGRADEAMASFEAAIARDARHTEALSNLGNLLAAAGRFHDAVPLYERALAIKPHWADAHNNLGNVLAMLGRSDDAIAHLARAAAIDPGYADARYNLGVLLLARGAAADAVAHLDAAAALRPEGASVFFHLGRALDRIGKPRDAVRAFERSVTLDGRNVDALATLAWLRATSADPTVRSPEAALTFAERARALNPENIAGRDALAAALAARGEYAQAATIADAAAATARQRGDTNVADTIAARAALYRAGRPFTESPPGA